MRDLRYIILLLRNTDTPTERYKTQIYSMSNDTENKSGVLGSFHLHQLICSQSFDSNDLDRSYCAPLPLGATNFENGYHYSQFVEDGDSDGLQRAFPTGSKSEHCPQ